jgi:hypothetical protein
MRVRGFGLMFGGGAVSWANVDHQVDPMSDDEPVGRPDGASRAQVPAELIRRMIRDEDAYAELGPRHSLLPSLPPIPDADDGST